jgi:hypothetical protein
MITRQFLGRSGLAIGVTVLTLVGGLGVATAANGGSLILGHHNKATSTTTLKDGQGIPLSLVGKKSEPPLRVNSSKEVKHLNAAEVGGRAASQLGAHGSSAQLKFDPAGPPRVVALEPPTTSGSTTTFHPTAIVSTAVLRAGTYAATATALASNAYCWIDKTAAAGAHNVGFAVSLASVAETATVKVSKGQRIHEYCAGGPENTSREVESAGITVLKLTASSTGVAQHPTTPTG